MRVETSLGVDEAVAAIVAGLTTEGVTVLRAVAPIVEAELVITRRGAIRKWPITVTVEPADGGSVVTVNGRNDAYLAGRRVARTLPG